MKKTTGERLPRTDELARELTNFLSQKFGSHVKIIPTAAFFPEEEEIITPPPEENDFEIDFNLKPEELVAYLDQYIVRQDRAKAILATKICTHFNRIQYQRKNEDEISDTVGRIKNNILMLGPTGVGKTYMIKLIANKIGVPFVKGDATKFTEAGYVGADVEDLIRDLIREADHNLELAQYGIVYIDEVDKIASSSNTFGHDISRAGVQRALLKPMEETDIDLKGHDPIGMMEEFESFRRTGKRKKRALNTRNILFIMSGAFADIKEIIKKRVATQKMGFGAKINTPDEDALFLRKIKSEDLIEYGFESEFVGRLPVNAVLDPLSVDDLYAILKNPNNPTILGKKMDFMSYGIRVKFSNKSLHLLAEQAHAQRTGARGLVSSIEQALLSFEKKLPSTEIKQLGITKELIESSTKTLDDLLENPKHSKWLEQYNQVAEEEKNNMIDYIRNNRKRLAKQFNIEIDDQRIEYFADFCCRNIMDLESSFSKIQDAYNSADKIEADFKKAHKVEIIFDKEARDHLIHQQLTGKIKMETFYEWLNKNFEYGLKLVREKSGKTSFIISKSALLNPNAYLEELVKNELKQVTDKDSQE